MQINELTLGELFKEYYGSEGWHAIYKKYGGAVLARDNYRWKRKIMKRFGPNTKMQFRIQAQRTTELWDFVKKSDRRREVFYDFSRVKKSNRCR